MEQFAIILLLKNKNNPTLESNVSLFLITRINCPTVKSAGTKYLVLSKSGKLESDFSTITGILSGYFSLILLDSFHSL